MERIVAQIENNMIAFLNNEQMDKLHKVLNNALCSFNFMEKQITPSLTI